MMAVGNEIINSGPDIFIFPANAFLFLHFLNKKDDATQKKKHGKLSIDLIPVIFLCFVLNIYFSILIAKGWTHWLIYFLISA